MYYQNRYYIYKRSINNSRSLGNETRLSGPRYDWYAYGLEAHPTDNNVLYYSSWRRHSIKKFTLNSSKTSYTENASRGQCCRGTSNASRQYIYYGRGLGLDSTNNRLAIGSYYGSQVHAFDFNLTYLKSFGASPKSRMDGAHEAIKAIVTDLSLIHI